ncbi:MAG: hypothetical protein R2851_14145 [Caldilineaceae bacterium]
MTSCAPACAVQIAAATAPDLAVDIIVVDNASVDDSAGSGRAPVFDVHLLALDTNLGFTGGNNLALHLLGFPVDKPAVDFPLLDPLPAPDAVLLLNPDTELARMRWRA